MKTSKALKALLVFGMSIATATSLATATACNDDKPSGHDHDYQWVTTDAQHWKECKADGHEGDKIDPAT
ncbi:MAG: hypothetical protein K2K80_04145, partial [Clostridia bacterium]|nr:hypothetical protein [Clostridia bacterium]